MGVLSEKLYSVSTKDAPIATTKSMIKSGMRLGRRGDRWNFPLAIVFPRRIFYNIIVFFRNGVNMKNWHCSFLAESAILSVVYFRRNGYGEILCNSG